MNKYSLHNLPVRKSIRLKGWDYENPGFYFITICAYQNRHFFGEIKDGKMYLSNEGRIAKNIWSKIPAKFFNTHLDAFVIMPNHIHGILQLIEDKNFNPDAIDQASKSSQIISTDAINRVRTDDINGGITGSKNPMLSNGNLGRIIRWYKGRATYEIRKAYNSNFRWHSRFYDHIIRNEKSLHTIRNYIFTNPENWNRDRFSNKSPRH